MAMITFVELNQSIQTTIKPITINSKHTMIYIEMKIFLWRVDLTTLNWFSWKRIKLLGWYITCFRAYVLNFHFRHWLIPRLMTILTIHKKSEPMVTISRFLWRWCTVNCGVLVCPQKFLLLISDGGRVCKFNVLEAYLFHFSDCFLALYVSICLWTLLLVSAMLIKRSLLFLWQKDAWNKG